MAAYQPPSMADMRDLKARLGLTGRQMAELFFLASDTQWRKYTGGAEAREMSLPQLFLAAARIELTDMQLEAIMQRMRAWGASVDLTPDGTPGCLDIAAAKAAAEADDERGMAWWNGMTEPQRLAALRAAQSACPPGTMPVSVAATWRYFGRKAPATAV